jgi:hypothetical protein
VGELSRIERDDLARCESVVERGLATFIEVDSALMRIRDGRPVRRPGYTISGSLSARGWGLKT